ncbi:Golgi-associated RAB2 interactor protein 6-like [Discoglossus pictus]
MSLVEFCLNRRTKNQEANRKTTNMDTYIFHRYKEYDFLKNLPIVEDNFIQVNELGGPVNILNCPTIISVGYTASNPEPTVPDILLLAEPKPMDINDPDYKDISEKSILKKMYPMELVTLSVSNLDEKRLKLTLANGRQFYLQIFDPSGDGENKFRKWVRLVYLLKPTPKEKYATSEILGNHHLSANFLRPFSLRLNGDHNE